MLIPVCIHSTGSHSGAVSRPFGPPTAPRLKWNIEIRKPLNLEGHCSRHDTNSLLPSCVGHALGSDLFKHDTENEINAVRSRVARPDACNSQISCNQYQLVRQSWILLLQCCSVAHTIVLRRAVSLPSSCYHQQTECVLSVGP